MDNIEQNSSPLPQEESVAKMQSFFDILPEVLVNKKIKRIAWDDDTYGFIGQEELRIMIHGKLHSWIVTAADMLASDWIIVGTDVVVGEVVS